MQFLSEAGGLRRYEEQLGDVRHPVQLFAHASGGSFTGVVPAGHYFMMGDNRDNSRDSRFAEVGYIPETRLVGKVAWVLYRAPLQPMR